MKKLFSLMVLTALFATSCTQEPGVDSVEVQTKMKTVVLTADMGGTKAAIDSQTGAFTWQSGDLLSVMATDGKFYDFILTGEAGGREAEFEGEIPEGEYVSTVATYPRIVANGATNTVYADGVLKYQLPTEWNYAKEVSNVPMVAAIAEGGTHMAFKQVGGVIRFTVNNLPTEADFILTVDGKTITGEFPVELATLGTSAMTAGDATSTLTIHYASSVDGESAVFNVPVPTGVYNKFNVTIKDVNDVELVNKDYVKADGEGDFTVERANLVMMEEITITERPILVAEVWPFFVDARVVFQKHEGVTKYAVYVDGATTPEIVDVEDLGDMAGVLVGGDFEHNTTHTVAIAKVVNDEVIVKSKSAAIEFTTANIRQLTLNTGTKFVTAAWDDVAIANGAKYDDAAGKWNLNWKLSDRDGEKGHQRRGYQVRLMDANGNVLYDMIPFDGHSAFTNLFSDSSWIAKKDGVNAAIPTALAFGYLEPNSEYFFRVKTLDEPVIFDATNGNYNPDGVEQPYPYVLYSERGGCNWSHPVKLTTNAPHTASENEVLFEGFEDIMVATDYMNWAPAVVPDLDQTRSDWDTYHKTKMVSYPEFLQLPHSSRKWTTQAFSKTVQLGFLGFQDVPFTSSTWMTFNEKAGSLAGWSWFSKKDSYGVYPIFGAMRLGQGNGTGNNSGQLRTAPLNSDKLLSNVATKCILTVKIAYSGGAKPIHDNGVDIAIPLTLGIDHYRDGIQTNQTFKLEVKQVYPNEYEQMVVAHNLSNDNYIHYQRYYEMQTEVYLKKGDQLSFYKPTGGSFKGTVVIDDLKIEVVPGVYEQNNFVDDGIGTEPDDTNYDAFGLGEFPISYWWHIPTAVHNYDPQKTYDLHKDMADAGINVAIYNGEVDGSLAENKRIMDICTQLGMKFIGGVHEFGEYTDERIAKIKETLATSPTYIGEYVIDEPTAARYNELGDFVQRFMQAMPDEEPYINLYPIYAGSYGTSTYDAYIEEYIDKVPTKTLSYDYYGLMSTPGQIASDYYMNLDLVRSKTLKYRMPFWVITQSGVTPSRKQPTEKEERWSVWSNIAGGSKGISYFCYWTPNEFDNYMIERDGTKTDMYYYIQKLNADINTIGKKLLPAHADGVILSNVKYYPLYDNAGKGRTKYGPIQSVSAVSNHVAVGCFRDARRSENGENYKGYKVLVVAQNPAKDITTRLTLDTSVTTITVTQNNTSKVVNLTNLTSVTVADENGIELNYADGKLTLNIPEGEALLIEF